MHDYVCFIAPIDFCVELSLIDKTFCKIVLISYWKDFSLIPMGEMCFLQESFEKILKNQILKILRAPSIQNQGVCL